MPKFIIDTSFIVEADSEDAAQHGCDYAFYNIPSGDLMFHGITSIREIDKDGKPIVPDDEKCVECSESYTAKDIDGGRCLSCGAMICAEHRQVDPEHCGKCGCALKAGLCTDDTCPYSVRAQGTIYTEG